MTHGQTRACGRVLMLALILWLLGMGQPGAGHAADAVEPAADLEVFTREGCPHCAAAKRFLDDLQRERPALRIVVRDIGRDPAALARLKTLATHAGARTVGVPAFYLRGELLVGYAGVETTGRRLKTLLDSPLSSTAGGLPEGACPPEVAEPCDRVTTAPSPQSESIETRWFGHLSVQELGLPLFTLAIGLLDGFNPCSMWVLILMVSLLAGLHDRLKLSLIAGTFVAVQGLAYFAFMAAWVNVFLLIGLSRATEVVVGGIASLAGVINIKDFWAFGRGLSLGIPQAAKPGLYAKIRGVVQAENLTGALAGVVVLGVLVQVVELVCTSGFPALYTRVLTMRHVEWWAYYGYLALYDAAYMLDDVIVLTIGVVTLSQHRLQEREARWLKLASGAVMLGLGVVLIGHPEWLAG